MTARKFMQIADAYGNRSGLNDLNIGVEAMAILAQNNTPDEVRQFLFYLLDKAAHLSTGFKICDLRAIQPKRIP